MAYTGNYSWTQKLISDMGLDIPLTDVFICNIAINTSGTYIYLLLSNNYLIIINNNNSTYTYSSTLLTTNVNTSIVSQTLTCDSTGQYVGICTTGGFYRSINYGANFKNVLPGFFNSCCDGDDGIFLAVQTNLNTLTSILYQITLIKPYLLYTSPTEPHNILSVNGNIDIYYFNPAWNDTPSTELYYNTTKIITTSNTLNVNYVDNTSQFVGIITNNSLSLSGSYGGNLTPISYFSTNNLYPTTMNSTNDSAGTYFVICCSYLNSTNFNIYTTINGGSTVTIESEIPQATSMPYICCTNGCNSSNYPIAVVASTEELNQYIYIGYGNTASSI